MWRDSTPTSIFSEILQTKTPTLKEHRIQNKKIISVKAPAFNLSGDIIKDTTKYTNIKDLVCMLVNETSITTLEVVMLTQRGRGGGRGRNNYRCGYSNLRGGASSLSN